MIADDVCAVIYGACGPPAAAEVEQAARDQTRPPATILSESAGVAAAVRAARDHGSRWIWLLDGCAVPGPGALEALLAAYEIVTPPPPVLLASKVVDSDGRLHPASMPRHEIFEKTHSVDAAERHLVQLRVAAHGSVLVVAEAVDRLGPPRTDLPPGVDMYAWSARILRSHDDIGYLVPSSVAVRSAPATAPGWREWLGRARLLGGGAWGGSEKLWEAFLLASDPGFRDGRASAPRASAHRAGRDR